MCTKTKAAGAAARGRGSALVVVLVIITSVLLIGVALFILGTGESGIVEHNVDRARAFYLAESGLARARTWLEQQAQQFPPQYPEQASFEDQALGGGQYDVALTRLPGANPWVEYYEVISTGEIDNTPRQVRAIYRQETFAQYVYFADESANIWFITGNRMDGRVHVNGHIRISGDPWFGMKVTSAENEMIMANGSNPIFEAGYELGVDYIPLPVSPTLAADLASDAQSGGTYGGTLNGSSARYEVEIGRDGLGTVSYRARERVGGTYQWGPWTPVDIEATNGIMWFEEPVYIEGLLDGQLTVGSAGDISITDNILYEDSTAGEGPNPGCDDVLGMVSAGDVIVYDTPENLNNVEIHAHMIALDESFTARNYNSGPPRGDLTIYGGFAQKKIGAVGIFGSGHVILHGYNKVYHFDRNLMVNSPPGYPPTGRYILTLWEEISPPQA